METYPSTTAGDERNESPAQRLDRNWSELLSGLRVAQTGIQILSAFLLMVPFQARFTALQRPLVGFFVAAMVLGTLSTALLVAPAMAHRLLFRQHAKDVLVRLGNVLAILGLLFLSLTVSLSMVVALGFVAGVAVGMVGGGVCLVVLLALWVALPLVLLRIHQRDGRG
ncbi:MAG TPA: DUF6328 family protein [Propionibacteriaceae bacterium]|nr:DUF6328 family protein [Propionibacteriaceae bacterium]